MEDVVVEDAACGEVTVHEGDVFWWSSGGEMRSETFEGLCDGKIGIRET